MSGRLCKYCDAPTPYTDWEWCERCHRARILWAELSNGHSDTRNVLDIRRHIDAAVAAERERCAKLCDDLENETKWSGFHRDAARLLAIAIRGAGVPK